MNLNKNELKNKSAWEEKGIKLPAYDVEKVRENTKENPVWLHFGAGNIFRIFMGLLAQDLLDEGAMDSGIVVAETFDTEIVDRIFDGFDHLTLGITMHADGSLEKEVIASIVDSLKVGNLKYDDVEGDNKTCLDIFSNRSLQIITFTVTEKGYALKNINGDYLPVIETDIKSGLGGVSHVMSILTLGLYKRYKSGAHPIAVVSTDNCSHNGDKVKEAVNMLANEWLKAGFVDEGFLGYINDEAKVSFPLTMIDKITPRPSDEVKAELEKLALENMDVIITEKNTYTAPFVNAEKCQYLVVEDKFPNGRPKLEKAGVYFCDRDTVNNVETMKVTTCLNPLHTALAVGGCLLGYTKISDEMKDETLFKWVKRIGYLEGLKVVVDPKILEPKKFIDEVVGERLPNAAIPDTPQRIATDTSQKVAIRFGKTIEKYIASPDLDEKELVGISLALAAWLRYLLAFDDKGNEMELSPDPLKDELMKEMSKIKFPIAGTLTKKEVKDLIAPVLGNKEIFGMDMTLNAVGDMVAEYFYEMASSVGAVRAILERELL